MKKMAKKEHGLEKYLSGAGVAFLWQIIFVKAVLALDWYTSLAAAVMTGIIFFIVAVLFLETSALKGNL